MKSQNVITPPLFQTLQIDVLSDPFPIRKILIPLALWLIVPGAVLSSVALPRVERDVTTPRLR